MKYQTENGVEVDLEEIFEIKGRGIVFTGELTALPDGKRTIDSGELSSLLRGQKLFGREIIGVEMFATLSQHIGRAVGLLIVIK